MVVGVVVVVVLFFSVSLIPVSWFSLLFRPSQNKRWVIVVVVKAGYGAGWLVGKPTDWLSLSSVGQHYIPLCIEFQSSRSLFFHSFLSSSKFQNSQMNWFCPFFPHQNKKVVLQDSCEDFGKLSNRLLFHQTTNNRLALIVFQTGKHIFLLWISFNLLVLI